ncbi:MULTISPECIES: hypothetical protein [Campylobacter]|jgi:hypothetical protein|uniref:Lipoprotein n=1 Tax=Campylobacter vicugnae TaxID=1660076 RepID=A0A1X9T2X0_9BACT|nr:MULTISPECIES: hypothetical protein [unclassified Campylobacter]MCR8689715.1 hypothetical protein [Campylobacter sp. RM9264]MCR8701343.1 hypothetical protein [Campylobacter sp. RM12176]ARR02877.1 hypothetical protein CVIC8964_1498 [Campylobacter sp. RM8964]MBQ8819137.1 hypothetical protein [Campylobacter sp.]MBR2149206.1 hypothetical protein [Campylobacter sp.]
MKFIAIALMFFIFYGCSANQSNGMEQGFLNYFDSSDWENINSSDNFLDDINKTSESVK